MLSMSEIASASAAKNEYADCTVCAIAAATGVHYDEAHEAMRRQGRKNRRGSSVWAMERACRSLGFEMVKVANTFGATIRTAQRRLPRGRKFILNVRGHVAGWDGRQLLDWADGRLHRIVDVYEVVSQDDTNNNKFFVKIVTAKKDHAFRQMARYNLVTPPARVHREKWARENAATICTDGTMGVIELKGDAAVAYRKETGERGRVFMIFGYKRG